MRMDFIRELLRSSSRRSWANLDGFGRPNGSNFLEQMEMLPVSPPVKHSQAQEWDLTKAKKCIGMDKYCGCGQLVVQNAQTCNVMCNCLWG